MTDKGVTKGRHEPFRMCVFCRRRYPKKNLIRFVAKRGRVEEDKTMKSPGRGAYVCKEASCLELAGLDKKGVLKRALKIA